MPLAGFLLATLIAQTPNPASIEGTVTNKLTGQPIKKAKVTLNLSPASAATTDAAGHFHFDNVAPGAYIVAAECPGYHINGSDNAVTIAAGQHIRDVAVHLTPLATASGRVFDEDGEPMRFVQVVAVHATYLPGRRQIEQERALTDDLGRFQIVNLQPGKYFFEASPANRQPLPEHTVSTIPEQIYPPTYYPNGAALSQAASVELKPGVEMGGLDFHFKPQPVFHVRGRIAATGQPLTPSQIELRLIRPGVSWGSHSETSVRIQSDGTFDFPNVVNGEYILLAIQLENHDNTFARQSITVSGKNAEDIVLAPVMSSSIQGVIAAESSDPNQLPGNTFVTLVGIGDFQFGARPFPITKETFHIQGMMPDLYRINMGRAQPGKYLKAIQLNGRDLPDAKLDLTNPVLGDMRILIGSDPGTIRGAAQTGSGTPAANVTVTAAPPEDRINFPGLFQSTRTDQNGNFQIPTAAPGDYKIIAWEVQDGSEALNLDLQRLFETKAVKVSLQPNGNESVQLVAISAADIEAAKEKLP
jgi:protocatechuate 3,4-dioxygenase beta subunit